MSTIAPQSNTSGSFSFRGAQGPQATPEMPAKARSLVAAAVAERANPTAQSAAPASGSLAFYRHPADRNQAATAILAGRTLDVKA